LSSVSGRQDAVAVEAHSFFKQDPDGSAAPHAVATPRIQPLQKVWAKPEAEWTAKLHGFG
jgi:hypothetical protein